MDTTRNPPSDIATEACVLGEMLLDQKAIPVAVDMLTADDFYNVAHRRIFGAIYDLYSEGEQADIVTVADTLRMDGTLDQIGGTAFMTTLVENVMSTKNVAEHCRIVREYSDRRRAITIGQEIVEHAANCDMPILDVLEQAHTQVLALERNDGNTSIEFKDCVSILVDDMNRAALNKTGLTGIPTGFKMLDDKMGGWTKGEPYYVGAHSSHCKSTFVMNCTKHAALRGLRCWICSLEMQRVTWVRRFSACLSRVDYTTIRHGHVAGPRLLTLMESMKIMRSLDITIDDARQNPSTSSVVARARRLHEERPLDLIIVDYLQKLEGSRNAERAGGNRDITVINETVRAFGHLCKDLNVPMVIASQITRPQQKNIPVKRPTMRDLKGSGNIENEAHGIIGLWYEHKEKPDKPETLNTLEMAILKYQDGASTPYEPIYFDPTTYYLADSADPRIVDPAPDNGDRVENEAEEPTVEEEPPMEEPIP